MPSNRTPRPQAGHTVIQLKPMPLWQTGVFFGVPTVLVAVGFLIVLPALQQSGMQRMYAYTAVQMVVIGGLIPAALIAMALEGRPINWPTIRARLRLKPIHGESWNWMTMGILVFVGSYYAGLWLVNALTKQAGLPFPDTNYPLDAGSAVNRGLWILNLVVGIAAEELWWRGYVLPRQELVHGQRTWLLHGVLWALVHVGSSGWFVIGLIIPCCALAFIAQGLKNTTPGIAMQVFVASLNLILGGL